ncbi:MAG: carboxypeptidase-like regulatory domain-containing protein [Bacteroidetes bacterium]|nr:carboxypeptidase-like regulatory domain-containing protein [Bacteroidota bacterium]
MKFFRSLLLGVLALSPILSHAQAKKLAENPYILFTGLVLTADDSLRALPYVAIKNNRRGLIGYTNEVGHFDVVVKKGDTIWFTQAEKISEWHVIPDTLTANKYHVIKLMAQDTIDLPVIFIRALPLKTMFDHDFVNADIADDMETRANKNMESEVLKENMKLKPADAKESQQLLAQTRANQLYYYKQAPPQNYLSPLVWAQFIEAWKRGDFKKKNKK